MPQIKQFAAKKDLKLDCGHNLKAGEEFEVISIYTCGKETWLLKVLSALFQVKNGQK